MEHLNLGEYLRNNRDAGKLGLVRLSFLSPPLAIILVSRHQLLAVARAMMDIHNLNVIHGNLEIVRTLPSLHFGYALTFIQKNIFIDAGGRVRLAGLGAVSIPSTMPGVDVDRSFDTVPELIDPQCFGLSDTECTMANDIYAFGIIAWEVSRVHKNASGRNPNVIESSSGLRWASSILR